jgi:aspartate/methionine/tyrosine aminotransferase
MNNDAKLQKVTLGPDWIDLSFGEPKVVTEALMRQLNRFGDPFKMPVLFDLLKWEYQPAAGSPDLVAILEEKYGARVVVTNGAKQALDGAFTAFKNHGYTRMCWSSPFYPANPGLAQSAGLTWASRSDADGLLLTSPNNPDGANISNASLLAYACDTPVIHDAAYYTEIYMPDGELPIPLGKIQIYSASKMYGLSGLRIGYAVIHDETFYQDVVNFIEERTAGVSTASQDIIRSIELMFKQHPSYYKAFMKEARAAIALSRKELNRLDPRVLELMPCNSNSMFGWFKAGPALDAEAAKVYILSGELFGAPGMMRMNIAHKPEVIRQAVDRLNAAGNHG